MHHVPVDDCVQVLPQHVEEEPVADFAAPYYRLDSLSSHKPKPQAQQVDPRSRRKYDNDLEIKKEQNWEYNITTWS